MKQPIYATIHKGNERGRDGDHYKEGEIVEISLWRRHLLKQKNKNEKVIKLMTYEPPKKLKASDLFV